MFNFNFKKIFIIFVVSLNFGITNTVFCMKKENEKKLTNQSSKKNLKPVKKQSKTIENKPTCTSKKQTDIHPKKNLSKAKPKISSTSKKTTIPKKPVNTTKEQTTLLKDITQTTKKIDKKAKEKKLKNIKINSEEPKTKNQDNNNIEKINNCILKFSPLGLIHDSYDDSLIGTWEMLRKTGVYSIYNNFNKATNILNDDKTFRDSNGRIIGKWEKRANDKFYIESNENINTESKKEEIKPEVKSETENIDANKKNEQPKANKQEKIKNNESIKKENINKMHFIDNSIFLPYIKNHKNIDNINFVQLNTAFLKLFYKLDKSQNSKNCEFTDFFSHYLAISNAILINEFLENNETWPLDAINNIEIQYNKLQKYMQSETEKNSNTSISEQKKKIKNEISKLGLSKKITVIDDTTNLTGSIKKSIFDNFKNLENYYHSFIISTNDLNVLLRLGIIQMKQESKCELSEKEQQLFFSKERFSNNWYVIGVTKQDKEITCLISDANGYSNHIDDQVLSSRNKCLCDYLIKQKDFEICRNEFYKKNMAPILKGLNILSFPPKLLNAIEESEKEDNKKNQNQNNDDKSKVKNVNKEPKNQSSDTTIKDSSNTNSTANSVTTKMTAKERVNQVLDFARSKNILMEGVNLLEVTPENGQKITNTVYQLRVAQQRQNSCGPRALYNAHCLKTAFDNDQGIYLKGVDMLNDLNDLSDDSENPKIRSFFREMHGATKTTYKTNDKTKARILDENRKAIPVEERIFIGKFDFDIDDGAPVWVDANPLNDFINFCSPINNKLFKIKDIDVLPGYAESFIDEFIDATKKDLIGSLPKKNIGFSHGYVILIPGHYISLVVVKTGENEYIWFTLDSSNDSRIEKDYTKAYICKLLGYNDQEYEKKVKKSTKDYAEAEEKRLKKEHETKLKKADLKSKENTAEKQNNNIDISQSPNAKRMIEIINEIIECYNNPEQSEKTRPKELIDFQKNFDSPDLDLNEELGSIRLSNLIDAFGINLANPKSNIPGRKAGLIYRNFWCSLSCEKGNPINCIKICENLIKALSNKDKKSTSTLDSEKENVPFNRHEDRIARPNISRELEDIAFESAPNELKDLITNIKLSKYRKGLPKVIILHGPPGTGKTTLGTVIGNRTKQKTVLIPSSSIGNSFANSASENLKEILEDIAKENQPYVIIIDEADEITKKREHHSNNTSDPDTVVAREIDKYMNNKNITFIFTTNNLDDIEDRFKNRNSWRIKVDEMSLEKRTKTVEYFLNDAKILLHSPLSKEYISKKLGKFSTRQIEFLVQQAGLRAARKYPEENLEDENLLVALTKNEFDQEFVRAKAIIDEDKPWWKPIIENKTVKFFGNKFDKLLDAGVSSVPGYVEGKLNEPAKEKEVKGTWNKSKKWLGNNWGKALSAGVTLISIGLKIFGN